ncbi:MAG: alpha/beta fold hydrolase [Pseudomonadales bacterium]|nr:alpha/beta fold hydrolase [Pseudomonadales bacterium]
MWTLLFVKSAKSPMQIVGHSLGGMIAQSWLHQGGACSKVVLAQTTSVFGKPGSQWNEDFLKSRLEPLEQGKTPADFAQSLIESMFFDVNKRPAIAAGVATMSPISAARYRQVIECLVTFNEADNLTSITHPTLCLAAEHDRTAPPKAMEKMSNEIPNARFICLPNAGHLAYLETPPAFTQAIEEFLTDV